MVKFFEIDHQMTSLATLFIPNAMKRTSLVYNDK